MTEQELKDRAKRFAHRCVKLADKKKPMSYSNKLIRHQSKIVN